MLFTLEALDAGKGDALLLHFGTIATPELIVIDGGPSGVYRRVLKPRLEELRASRGENDRLTIRLAMVSHIDDDHINGILGMLNELDDLRTDRKPQPYDILALWHNSFDDILGNEGDVLTANLATAATAAAKGNAIPGGLPIHQDAALVLASVGQGRELQARARALSIGINTGFENLVGVPPAGPHSATQIDGGVSLTVLAPAKQRVDDLRKEWDTQIKKMGVARQAAFVDDSVFNLSSIVVLARAGTKTMLLTGDARGDHVLEGLNAARLLDNGKCHVNVLKVPHHGSDRNVSTEFFRQVTADHYVISANGQNGNPDVPMLEMLSAARAGDDRFTVHLTNREPRLTTFFDAERSSGRTYSVDFRDPQQRSLRVELGDRLAD
jgi:beta-lactamase superfamily II metal-dependent hydrolase